MAATEPRDARTAITKKLGIAAVCFLVVGLVILTGAMGFLWFLWSAGDTNRTWRGIVSYGWVNRVIVLSALAIRQAISFQSTVATAMLACLAIEKAVVLMLNLASVSLSRNSNGGPFWLTWWLWRGFSFDSNKWKKLHLPVLCTVMLCTSLLSQLTSFALISDVESQIVRGFPSVALRLDYFQYDANGSIPISTRGSTWSQQPQSYVAFGEYHEAPKSNLPDGVDDTGLTMRAFLPIVSSETRSMVTSWNGKANVLDARVVCVRPMLTNPRLHYADLSLVLEARFDPDLQNIADVNLVSVPSLLESGFDPVFACMIPLTPQTNPTGYQGNAEAQAEHTQTSQWRMVICQPWVTLDVLQSELRPQGQVGRSDSVPNYSFGAAYIVLNVSAGTDKDWGEAISGEDPNLGLIQGPGYGPLAYSVHGKNNEWYDLIYSDDASTNLSVTICYTAFDTADLQVELQATSNHSDLSPGWSPEAGNLNYTNIRAQFGQSLGSGLTAYSNTTSQMVKRNIMALTKRQSWLPEVDIGDYVVPTNRQTQTSWITDYANMAGSYQSNGFIYGPGPNTTRFMWQAWQEPDLWADAVSYDFADNSLYGLVQEILQSGGGIAFAMQSIVTVLTQIAYYQQLQRLNGASNTTLLEFVVVSTPVRFRGLFAVTVVVLIHILCIFGVILPLFLYSTTRLSTLGNSWQVVGQLLQARTVKLLDAASLEVDSVAEEVIMKPIGKKGKLQNRDVIGLRISRTEERVEIFDSGTTTGADLEGTELIATNRTYKVPNVSEEMMNQEDETRAEQTGLLQQNYGHHGMDDSIDVVDSFNQARPPSTMRFPRRRPVPPQSSL